jgi:acetyltransferase
VNLGCALGKVLNRPGIFEASTDLSNYDRRGIEDILKGQKGVMAPESAAGVLKKAGFRLPRQVEITSKEQLDAACEKIGYPLVMKVIGPLHKSDLNGVEGRG